MSATETWTEAELFAAFDESCHPVLRRWLARGDGAAVFENVDVGHPDSGHLKALSYGSPLAQLEVDSPPEQMPDVGRDINWRYRLKAMCRPSRQAPA